MMQQLYNEKKRVGWSTCCNNQDIICRSRTVQQHHWMLRDAKKKKNSAPGVSSKQPHCSVYLCLDNGRVSDRSLINSGGSVAKRSVALCSEKGKTHVKGFLLQALFPAACSHPGAASAWEGERAVWWDVIFDFISLPPSLILPREEQEPLLW